MNVIVSAETHADYWIHPRPLGNETCRCEKRARPSGYFVNYISPYFERHLQTHPDTKFTVAVLLYRLFVIASLPPRFLRLVLPQRTRHHCDN
jgi:hypothetical protein